MRVQVSANVSVNVVVYSAFTVYMVNVTYTALADTTRATSSAHPG